MRGADTFTESLFTMRRLDDFVPDNHPLRAVRKMVNLALTNIEPLLYGMYAADIKGGRAREAAARHVPANLLQHSFGTPADGADPIQPALSLVHRPVHP